MKVGNTHVRGGWNREMVKFQKAPKYVKEFILERNNNTIPDSIYIEKENDFGTHVGYTVVIDGKVHLVTKK